MPYCWGDYQATCRDGSVPGPERSGSTASFAFPWLLCDGTYSIWMKCLISMKLSNAINCLHFFVGVWCFNSLRWFRGDRKREECWPKFEFTERLRGDRSDEVCVRDSMPRYCFLCRYYCHCCQRCCCLGKWFQDSFNLCSVVEQVLWNILLHKFCKWKYFFLYPIPYKLISFCSNNCLCKREEAPVGKYS